MLPCALFIPSTLLHFRPLVEYAAGQYSLCYMNPNVDLNKAPKQFCENITAGFSPEFFVLGLQTGVNGTAYAITPQHAKRLAQYLTHQVTEFEKQFGEIKAQWNPNIQSPIQIKPGQGNQPDDKKES